MEPIKSIAVPVTRRRGSSKSKLSAPSTTTLEGGAAASSRLPQRAPSTVVPARLPLYSVGQRLSMSGGGSHWVRAQAFCRVLAILPRDAGPFLYRVRSEVENYERVVTEADLAPVL